MSFFHSLHSSPRASIFLLSHHLAILEFGFGGHGHVGPYEGILEGAEFLGGREGERGGGKEQKWLKCFSLKAGRVVSQTKGGSEGTYLNLGVRADHSIGESHAIRDSHVVHEHALVDLDACPNFTIRAQDGSLNVDLSERREGGREGGRE